MALESNVLEAQLNALAKEDLSPEQANAKFAEIITGYIKTADVNVTGTGYAGVTVQSKGGLS